MRLSLSGVLRSNYIAKVDFGYISFYIQTYVYIYIYDIYIYIYIHT